MTQLEAAISDQSFIEELRIMRAEVINELSGLHKTEDSLQLMISEQSI